MNNKGQIFVVWLVVLLLIVITTFALIEPLKETLDNNRGGDTLNCPNTPTFNQTSYDTQNTFEKLTYRTTCFVTGVSMVWFVGAVLITGVVWVYDMIRTKKVKNKVSGGQT